MTNNEYWNNKYLAGETGWDIGYPSTPIKEFADQLDNKDLKILIPGAGNAYEAEYLWNIGFANSHIVDISEQAIGNFLKRVPDFPIHQVTHKDFFDLNEKFDLILEQTFFCAIPKSMREKYVTKCHDLLNENGSIAGLLFNIPLHEDHPPYGGSKEEYKSLFKEKFSIEILEQAYNSIPPRSGNELFFLFRKR